MPDFCRQGTKFSANGYSDGCPFWKEWVKSSTDSMPKTEVLGTHVDLNFPYVSLTADQVLDIVAAEQKLYKGLRRVTEKSVLQIETTSVGLSFNMWQRDQNGEIDWKEMISYDAKAFINEARNQVKILGHNVRQHV